MFPRIRKPRGKINELLTATCDHYQYMEYRKNSFLLYDHFDLGGTRHVTVLVQGNVRGDKILPFGECFSQADGK